MVGRRLGQLVAIVVVLVSLAGLADARITLRRRGPSDNFFFHGNYGFVPFAPSDDFSLEIWNCAGGQMPLYVADREPLIVCAYDPTNGYTLGDLVYTVDVPGGTCVDRGRSCYYRNPYASFDAPGLRKFRVQYALPGHGNRVWLDSYGDLSTADQANMLILIKVNGHPTAARSDTFLPLASDGWYTH